MFEDLKVDEMEKRRFERVNYETELNCIIVESENNKQVLLKRNVKINIINISLGGISVMCTDKIEIGTCLQFTLDIEKSHHVVTAEVVYCEKQNDDYKIGMEFVTPKPALLERIKRFVMKQ